MGFLNLLGRISLDASPFHAALRGVGVAAAKTGAELNKNLMKGLGPAAFLTGVGLGGRAIVAYADGMAELADRIRTGTTSAQEWNLAAKMNGEEADFIAQNFQKMEKSLIAASKGQGDSAKSLTALVDDAMRRLQDPTAKVGTESERAAAFLDIFGKSASKVRVVLDDLEKTTVLTMLGGFASEAAIRNVKDYADAWATVGTVLKSIGAEAISPGGLLATLTSGQAGFGSLGALFRLAGGAGLINRTLAGAAPKAGGDSDRAGKDAGQQIAKVLDRARELQERNRISQLTDEERLNELVMEREEAMNRIAINGEERAKKELDLAENDAEFIALKRNLDKVKSTDSRSQANSILSNALSSVGNFLGQSTNSPQLRELSEQTKTLKSIDNKIQPGQGLAFPL